MEEATEQGSGRTVQHANKASEIDLGSVQVVLSQGLREAFGRLHKIVKDGAFNGENELSLKEFSNFPETSLRNLILELPQIAQQAEEHVSRTGDPKARYALLDVVDQLAADKGFQLSKLPPKREI